ncbi:MAG: hypothetical protein EOM24_09775, partial [Chloroflexia bacterium]|nr:hypothetical protein [Chloroflexia bacterium]
MKELSDLDLLRKARKSYEEELERSAVGEVATGLLGGVSGQLPRMVGQAARAFADDGSDVDLWGQEVVKSAEERLMSPEYRLNPDAHGGVTNAFASGAQSLPASLATMAAAAGGTLAGGPALGAAAAAGTAGALFGGSAYQDTYDEVIAKTGDEDKARSAALGVGVVQGVGESALSLVGARFLTAAAPLVGKSTVAKALSRLKDPQTVRTFLKDTGKMVAAETSQEIIQDTSSEAIKASYTGEDTALLKTATETAGPAAAMTLLLAPFGIPARVIKDKRNSALVQTVESAEAEPAARLDAAMKVFSQLESIDKPEAQKWAAGVTKAIADGRPINIQTIQQDQQAPLNKARAAAAAQGGDALDQAAAGAQAAADQTAKITAAPQAAKLSPQFQTARPAPIQAPNNPLATAGQSQPVAGGLPVPRNLPVPQDNVYEPQVWPARPAGRLPESEPIDAEFVEVPYQLESPERKQIAYQPKPATGDRVVLPSGDPIALPVVTRSSGQPFSTEKAASAALRAQRLDSTHQVAPVDGGFVLRKIGTEAVPNSQQQAEPTPAPATATEFDLAAAERAYSGTSIQPERAAEVELGEFENYMAKVEKTLREDAAEGADVDAAIGRIRQAYLSSRQRVFAAREGALSSLVAGGSKFNSKQAGKRSDAVDRAESNFAATMRRVVAAEEQALGVSEKREARQAAFDLFED